MRIEIQLRIVGDDDSVISTDEVLYLDKSDDKLEAIGLAPSEAKSVLAAIQERVVTAQAASFLDRHRCCSGCGRALLSKGPGQIQFRTAFGTIPLNSPRFHRCRCQPTASLKCLVLSVQMSYQRRLITSIIRDGMRWKTGLSLELITRRWYQSTFFLCLSATALLRKGSK